MSTIWQGFILLCRVFVAGVFLTASHDKVWEPAAFADMMALYEMLPMWAVNAASVSLAWLEFTIGCFLLVGWWTRPSAAWASGLLIFFTGLMIYAGFTGAGYDCGCFPGQEGHPAGFETALRDMVFLIPAMLVFWRPGRWLALDLITNAKPKPTKWMEIRS